MRLHLLLPKSSLGNLYYEPSSPSTKELHGHPLPTLKHCQSQRQDAEEAKYASAEAKEPHLEGHDGHGQDQEKEERNFPKDQPVVDVIKLFWK